MTPCIWNVKIGKSIEMESRLMSARDQGKREREIIVKQYGISFWGDLSILELKSRDGYTNRECVQDHWVVFFFKIFFLMWTIFKVFIEFVTIKKFLFYVLVFWLQGMQDLSSWTRDQTLILCNGRQSLNHWTTREVPKL